MVLAVEKCRCFFTGDFISEHASDYETAVHCAALVRGAVSLHNNPVLQSENQTRGTLLFSIDRRSPCQHSAFISERYVRELQTSPVCTALTR
jgi:hypothetical protein